MKVFTMPSRVSWLVEQKVILSKLEGGYDHEGMMAGIRQIGSMIRSVPPPCHLIIDATEMTEFVRKFNEPLNELRHNGVIGNTGWTILISNNAIMRFFGTIAAKIMNDRFRAVSSFEEAKQLLHSIDPTLFDPITTAEPAAAIDPLK